MPSFQIIRACRKNKFPCLVSHAQVMIKHRINFTFLVVCTSSRSTVVHSDVPGFMTKWNNFLPIGNSTFAPTEIFVFFLKWKAPPCVLNGRQWRWEDGPMTLTLSWSINKQKTTWPISSHLDLLMLGQEHIFISKS